jgi:hypothetical protein
MKSGAKPHPVDALAEWIAPAILAVAAGWAASRLGGSNLAALGAAIAALAAGVAAMRLFGSARDAEAEVRFEPVPLDACIEDIGELLLDDPLVEMESDSRVVRLFARADATPGEMVARIENFLGDDRRMTTRAAEEGSASPPDASAALHAALANIRASLR